MTATTTTKLLAAGGNTASQSAGLRIENAYVQVGDQTVLMVGQKGSIFKNGDDAPLNFLGLFNSEGVDVGVDTPISDFYDGGPSAAIQVVSDLGNGLSVGVGAENLDSALGAGLGAATPIPLVRLRPVRWSVLWPMPATISLLT